MTTLRLHHNIAVFHNTLVDDTFYKLLGPFAMNVTCRQLQLFCTTTADVVMTTSPVLTATDQTDAAAHKLGLPLITNSNKTFNSQTAVALKARTAAPLNWILPIHTTFDHQHRYILTAFSPSVASDIALLWTALLKD